MIYLRLQHLAKAKKISSMSSLTTLYTLSLATFELFGFLLASCFLPNKQIHKQTNEQTNSQIHIFLYFAHN